MKFIGKFVFVPVAVVVVLFAIANRDTVNVNFWPLPFDAALPLYVALLGALAVGILLGVAASSFAVGKWRRRARTEARSATRRAISPEIGGGRNIDMPAAPTPARNTLPSVERMPAIPDRGGRYRAALDDD